ncbi:hypothetical protein [Burkholderia ambifaria]|uniref:hypothetical protein n=1 Tax=Burkholderia ambifaria TaxID=152480 RepID=UPI00158A4815|nr:hypothetical protein [Burkholderia ambifaria]
MKRMRPAARSSVVLRTSSVASGLSMNRQPRLIEVEVLNNSLPGDMNMPLCGIGCQPQYLRQLFKKIGRANKNK